MRRNEGEPGKYRVETRASITKQIQTSAHREGGKRKRNRMLHMEVSEKYVKNILKLTKEIAKHNEL
jgi:hypothetical protein